MSKQNVPTSMFRFTVDVEAIPYSPDTVEALLGENSAYIPDYPRHVQAGELLFEMTKDAILSTLEAQSDFLAKTKVSPELMNERDRMFWEHLKAKEKEYRKIEQGIKFSVEWSKDNGPPA